MPAFRFRLTNWPYFLALLIEAALFHRHVLFYPGYLFPWDFRAVHIPLATFIANSFRRGEFPLWDPYTYCGNPIYANIQSALFYPPVLLSTLLGATLGPELLPRILAWAVVLQIVFAGVCTFALLRRIGLRPESAWIGATVYELGCFFASQSEHMGAMGGAAWLPLVWLAVVEMRDGLRGAWLAILSIALAMTVLAGLPQVSVAAFGSALLLALLLGAFHLASWRLAATVFVGWIWGLLIAAIQIIPTAELTRWSVAKYRAEWLHSGGGIKLGALVTLAIPNFWHVFDLPNFHGPGDPTFLYLYSSLIGLALALAVILWKPDRWTRAFAVLFAAATLWMLGDSTPVGRLIFEALPVSIRIGIHPEFTLCVFSLALAVLAGYGANRFLPSTRWQLLVGFAIALDLLLVSSGRPMNTVSSAAEPGITHDSADGNRDIIARLRTLANSTTPPSRFDMLPSMPYLWSSSAPLFEIPTANGCDPLALERVIQVRLAFAPGARWGTCYQVVHPESPAVALVNDRYLLSRSASGAYEIETRPNTLPRFFFVTRTYHANNLAEAAAALHWANIDLAQTAILESPFETATHPPLTTARVDVLSYQPSTVTLATHTSTEAFLVATDSYYPGWQATIDGKRTPIHLADVAFRALRVPAGDHKIEMRFRPAILYRSAFVSIIALVAAVAVLLRPRNSPVDRGV